MNKISIKKLNSQTVAITGATGGLGKAICEYLAQLGANIIMINRSEKKSKEFEKYLLLKYPSLCIKTIIADFENIQSVIYATNELQALCPDTLILNAGAYSIPRKKTSLGFDNVFTINFVSPYYMARRMMIQNTKIVAVSSIAHRYSKSDFLNIDFSQRKKSSLVYGNAKRWLTYALYGTGYKNLSVTHPGISFTNITAHYPKLIFAIIKHPMKIIFMKPEKACLSILCGVFENCEKNEWIGPRIFDIWGKPKKKTLHSAHCAEAKQISIKSEEIYKRIQYEQCTKTEKII